MRVARRVLEVAVLLVAAGCQSRSEPAVQQGGEAATDAAATEAQIRTRSQELLAAEKQKDIETTMRYWGDSAVLHMEGAPAIRGHAAIKEAYGDFFAAPMTFDSATITGIRVAKSGDLAYETGVNHFTGVAGKKRTPATGKYLVVWSKRSDGAWVVESLAVTNDKAATP